MSSKHVEQYPWHNTLLYHCAAIGTALRTVVCPPLSTGLILPTRLRTACASLLDYAKISIKLCSKLCKCAYPLNLQASSPFRTAVKIHRCHKSRIDMQRAAGVTSSRGTKHEGEQGGGGGGGGYLAEQRGNGVQRILGPPLGLQWLWQHHLAPFGMTTANMHHMSGAVPNRSTLHLNCV